MITYVLLVMMLNSANPGLMSAEFNSLHSCESAATIAKTKFNGATSALFYICVPK